jgi:hypothetical protein
MCLLFSTHKFPAGIGGLGKQHIVEMAMNAEKEEAATGGDAHLCKTRANKGSHSTRSKHRGSGVHQP